MDHERHFRLVPLASPRPSATRSQLARIGLALAAATVVHARVAVAQLPPRLSDREFWQLIEQLSEPGGSFLSDNFVSNEARLQYVIPKLVKIFPPGGVYLGVGPEQNLTYIANLKPAMAIILDIRRQNMIEHLIYKAVMERAPTRADFLALLLSRPRPVGVDTASTAQALFAAVRKMPTTDSLYRANRTAVWDALIHGHGFPLTLDDERTVDYVYGAFYAAGPDLTYNFRPGRGSIGGYSTLESVQTADNGEGVNLGFLGSEANYRWLRELEMKNLVVPVVGDFAGPKALPAIGQYLRDHGAKVSVIYTSNVEEYLFQQSVAPRYYESVGALPLDPAATFIRSAVDGALIQSGQPGGRVTVLKQILCPVAGFLDAVRAGQIRSYRDVIAAPC